MLEFLGIMRFEWRLDGMELVGGSHHEILGKFLPSAVYIP